MPAKKNRVLNTVSENQKKLLTICVLHHLKLIHYKL